MSADEPFSGGAGGGGENRLVEFVRQYIRFGNIRDWRSIPTIERFDIVGLFTALISGFVLAWWTGIAGWIGAIGLAMEKGATWVTRAQSNLLGAVFGLDRVITLAVAGAQLEISRNGLAAFVIAVAIVGVSAYIINLGVAQLEQ